MSFLVSILCFIGLIVWDQYDKYTYDRPTKSNIGPEFDRIYEENSQRYAEFLRKRMSPKE